MTSIEQIGSGRIGQDRIERNRNTEQIFSEYIEHRKFCDSSASFTYYLDVCTRS